MAHRSGGFFYHWKALRHASLWQPFHQSLQQWMNHWQPHHEGLILIGASAGYSLATSYLQNYKKIVAIDPDPWSRALFTWRHSAIKERLHWDSHNYFPAGAAAQGIRSIRLRYPGAVIMFCNLLGQWRFIYGQKQVNDEDFIRQELAALCTELRKAPFLSFHDRLSGKIPPSLIKQQPISLASSNENLLRAFYPATNPDNAAAAELLDHFTGHFFDDLPRQYFCWQILPTQYHLIEGVFSL